VREKDAHKVLVILNFSAKQQAVKIADPSLEGATLNVFSGRKETIKNNQSFNINPWGYIVYDYDIK
jgi:hypothetical protein